MWVQQRYSSMAWQWICGQKWLPLLWSRCKSVFPIFITANPPPNIFLVLVFQLFFLTSSCSLVPLFLVLAFLDIVCVLFVFMSLFLFVFVFVIVFVFVSVFVIVSTALILFVFVFAFAFVFVFVIVPVFAFKFVLFLFLLFVFCNNSYFLETKFTWARICSVISTYLIYQKTTFC